MTDPVDEMDRAAPADPRVRRARIVPSGPILVEGPLCIEAPDGTTVESDRFMVAICTCRRSTTYPLCDTSHRKRKPAARKASKTTVEAVESDSTKDSVEIESAAAE